MCSATSRGNGTTATGASSPCCSARKTSFGGTCPARESLELNAKIYGIPKDPFDRTVAEMTELLDVKDKLNVSVRELSLGERMKMELDRLAAAQTRVLFLDEPTIGLDVVSQKTVREFLREYNAASKTTILLTSHYMADIQQLCRASSSLTTAPSSSTASSATLLDRFADFKLITIQCEGAQSRPPPTSPATARSSSRRRQHQAQGQARPRHPRVQGAAG